MGCSKTWQTEALKVEGKLYGIEWHEWKEVTRQQLLETIEEVNRSASLERFKSGNVQECLF
jgi:hypothetical protein